MKTGISPAFDTSSYLFLFVATSIQTGPAELGEIDTSKTALIAESAKVGGVVLILSFVLLILIDPLQQYC